MHHSEYIGYCAS